MAACKRTPRNAAIRTSQTLTRPSAQSYGGALIAADAVADHRLEDLPGVEADPLRDDPLIFIDPAGAGWQEARAPSADGERGSCYNPEFAACTADEVRSLPARGVPADAIVVLTPYDAQRRLLRNLLAGRRPAGRSSHLRDKPAHGQPLSRAGRCPLLAAHRRRDQAAAQKGARHLS